MGRACTVCTHPERATIDAALVAGEPYRDLSVRFGMSVMSVQRHKVGHIARAVAEAERRVEAERTDTATPILREQAERTDTYLLSVMGELRRCFERMNLLSDACDAWLRDADDPTRYDVGPRSDDVIVTYIDWAAGDPPPRRKAKLSLLLEQLRKGKIDVDRGETKVADPRELLIKVSGQLTQQTTLLVTVLDKLYNAREVEAFQRTVLDAVREAAPDVQHAIVASLGRRQPLHGTLPGGDRRGERPGEPALDA